MILSTTLKIYEENKMIEALPEKSKFQGVDTAELHRSLMLLSSHVSMSVHQILHEICVGFAVAASKLVCRLEQPGLSTKLPQQVRRWP